MTTGVKRLGLRVFTVTKNHQRGLDFPEPLSIISSELMGFGGFGGSGSRKLGSENKFILFSSASGFCGFLLHGVPGMERDTQPRIWDGGSAGSRALRAMGQPGSGMKDEVAREVLPVT